MADTIFTSQTPASSDFDGGAHAWGMKFTVSSNCSCTGGRAWVPSGGRPDTFYWQLWRLGDSTLLADSNLRAAGHGTPSSNTWMSFGSALFSTPGDVALETGQTYVVDVYFDGGGGGGVFTDPGTFPAGSGGLVSSSTGRFNNGSAQNVMPATDYGAFFFADVDAETTGTEHTKDLASSITPTTALNRANSRTLASSTTPAAAIAKQTTRTLAASITPAAAIASRAISRTLAAAATPLAALAKLISRLLGGSTTPSATVSDAPAAQDIATTFRVGPPHGRWHIGRPHGRWHIGRPKGE